MNHEAVSDDVQEILVQQQEQLLRERLHAEHKLAHSHMHQRIKMTYQIGMSYLDPERSLFSPQVTEYWRSHLDACWDIHIEYNPWDDWGKRDSAVAVQHITARLVFFNNFVNFVASCHADKIHQRLFGI